MVALTDEIVMNVIAPAALVVLLVNLLVPNPDPDDPSAVIASVTACRNHSISPWR